MTKHYALYSDGRGRNGLLSRKAGKKAKREAAKSAQTEAPASSASPAEQFGLEAGAMRSFMSNQVIQFRNHVWSAPSGDPALRLINADGAVFACVINFQDAVAERLAVSQGSS